MVGREPQSDAARRASVVAAPVSASRSRGIFRIPAMFRRKQEYEHVATETPGTTATPKAAKQETTPLPIVPLLVVCAVQVRLPNRHARGLWHVCNTSCTQLLEGVEITMLFPFVAYLLRDFGTSEAVRWFACSSRLQCKRLTFRLWSACRTWVCMPASCRRHSVPRNSSAVPFGAGSATSSGVA